MKQASGAVPARDILVKLLVTFFGIGYFPWGPGTMGSLAGIAIAWWAGPSFGFCLLFFTLLGFIAAPASTRVFNSGDPSKFVLDEVCGVMLAVLFIPQNFYLYLAGFLLFRFFDILKPWPISVIQRLKYPWAIMADDLVAAIIANLLLQAYLFFHRS